MDLNRRPDETSERRIGALAAALLMGFLAAPPALYAQTAPFATPLPVCAVPPSPATDTWPKAITDSLGSTPGAPVTFSGATLLSNDTGTGLSILSVGPQSSGGGAITGTGPYTYTPAAGFVGPDVIPYEIKDDAARTTMGLVKVRVAGDVTAPSVSISAPAGGTVSGTVLVTASAADNVAVAGVRFFDGAVPIGTEVTASPYQASWATSVVANGSHTLTAVARDAAGNTATSSPVVVNVANVTLVAVPGVVGLTETAARGAITDAGLSVGAVTTAYSPSVPAGLVISQNPVTGFMGATGSPVAFVVSLGPSAATPAVDKKVVSQGAGKRTTPAFSTIAPGEVLVAFAASDGPAAVDSQSVTIAGAGLSWTRVQRSASRFGVSEIWTATAPNVLTNVTVSSTQAVAGPHQSLIVMAFTGVSGVGASSTAGAINGAPTVSLITQSAGSAVYAVGNDWDRAVARSIPAGQTKVHEFVDTAVGDTFWVQSANAAVAAGVTVTLNAATPTNDQWNMAAVELRAGGVAAPASVTVPNVVGSTQAAAQTAITDAGLTVGGVTTASSASVPAGQVMSQTPGAGGTALVNSAVSLVVSSGPALSGPGVDAMVFSDGTGARTTPAFTTSAPGSVLLAFAASDGSPTGANTQSLTVSGAGLAWTRVQRAATQRGVAEIWTATATDALVNVTVTSTQSITSVLGAPVNQSLTVVAFSGASGVGASNVAGAASGAPTVSLTAQAAGSVVYAVGNDFDRAVARSIPAGQTKVHEFFAPTGDTFWVQSGNAATASAGSTVTLNATAPTNDQWNFAIVELKR